jgi:hypothetical protein
MDLPSGALDGTMSLGDSFLWMVQSDEMDFAEGTIRQVHVGGIAARHEGSPRTRVASLGFHDRLGDPEHVERSFQLDLGFAKERVAALGIQLGRARTTGPRGAQRADRLLDHCAKGHLGATRLAATTWSRTVLG